MMQAGKSSKWEETILVTTETIYIPLLDEGTDVSRPTLGIRLGGGFYEVLPTPGYDPEIETWAFPPRSIVLCASHQTSAGRVLMAQRLRSSTDV